MDEWLHSLDRAARTRCLARLESLAVLGFELRRPIAAHLEDGVHELRIKNRGLNLRMLYFFDMKTAVITHGFFKQEAGVPGREIERARRFQLRYLSDRAAHGFDGGE